MDASLTDIYSVLSTTADRWRLLTTSIPASVLTRPPASSEWSAADCLRHLLDAEQKVFPVRLTCFMEGRDFPAYDPNAREAEAAPQPPADMAVAFAALRKENLARVAQVTHTDFDRTARHAELGPVTLGQLLHEWAAHDLMHTVQAERAMMQPFIAACGPWQVYFTDHAVASKSEN